MIRMRDGHVVSDPRLGALRHDDPRSAHFPLAALALPTNPRSYTWAVNAWLDQGQEGTCVGHAIAHDALARPVRVPNVTHDTAIELFCRAQELDPFQGDCSEGQRNGTSLTAGMEAAREKGWFKEYRWAANGEDALIGIGYKGPGILAIDWHENMFYPDTNGWIRPTGNWAGRHALLAYSININTQCVWLWNNWSRLWGLNGTARLSFQDFAELLSRDSGEMAIPTIRGYGGKSE